MSFVGSRKLEVGLQASGFRLQTSDFRIQDSDFGLRTSGFRIQDSDFGLQDSDFRLQDESSALLPEARSPKPEARLLPAPCSLLIKEKPPICFRFQYIPDYIRCFNINTSNSTITGYNFYALKSVLHSYCWRCRIKMSQEFAMSRYDKKQTQQEAIKQLCLVACDRFLFL